MSSASTGRWNDGAGDLVNAPAIMSLQWLAVHRERLRAAAGAT
jgi:hypothetical protein